MKISTLRRSRSKSLPGITSVARVDRRTRNLAKRVNPGEIAVVDHIDMDRAAAVALAESGVVAVINVSPSISGRYPNLGPQHLVDSGIVLLDDVGGQVLATVRDGDLVRIDGSTVYLEDDAVATGVRQDRRSVQKAMEDSKNGIPSRLEALSANAVEHLRRERDLLLDGVGVPKLTTPMRDRQVLIVVRAFDYRRDIASLKPYLRENKPVLVGVDGGADALLEAGLRPDIIVCDGDDISEAALRCGAEVVVKAGHDGRVARGERIERLGVRHLTFQTGCPAEDAAMLLAHVNHASLIVTVGMPARLEELLDKGRSSMASSFLTRATVGSRVADAKAVSQLYHNRIRGWLVFLLVLVAIALVAAAVGTTPVGQDWWTQIHGWLFDGYDWARGQVT
ncbi:MAG: hypothetical protein QOI51_2470 [Nocardioidaceae bacterium]|jgi:uncharacterized membrane-anchored protein|nr:hypothetical protein [Nocardioidaceae bacterium]